MESVRTAFLVALCACSGSEPTRPPDVVPRGFAEARARCSETAAQPRSSRARECHRHGRTSLRRDDDHAHRRTGRGRIAASCDPRARTRPRCDRTRRCAELGASQSRCLAPGRCERPRAAGVRRNRSPHARDRRPAPRTIRTKPLDGSDYGRRYPDVRRRADHARSAPSRASTCRTRSSRRRPRSRHHHAVLGRGDRRERRTCVHRYGDATECHSIGSDSVSSVAPTAESIAGSMSWTSPGM